VRSFDLAIVTLYPLWELVFRRGLRMNDLRAPSFIARSEMSMFPPEPTYVSIKAFFLFAYDAMPAVTSLGQWGKTTVSRFF